MCGICGWAGADIEKLFDKDLLKKMTDAIKHRGPDGEGYFIEPGVAFGHRRLSILDIELGGQPFFSPSGRYALTYNGEVYNAPELRNDLIKKGHPFHTHCDTEVIAVLADEYDFSFVNMLEGIFAFGLWDRKEKKLLLARDGLGVKPLVYRIDNDGIRFSSEAKSFYADPSLSWTADPQALHHYLGLNYIPAPFTIYKETRKLGQGETLIWKSGKIKKDIYWAPPRSQNNKIDPNTIGERVHELVYNSVKGQLQSDVPLGIFLSAGIDSAIVLKSSCHFSNPKPTAFCVGFEEKSFDERAGARETANMLGAEMVEFLLEPKIENLLPKIAVHFDEPFADSSAIPVWELCRQSAKHVKVALSGEGGDEVFCGYEPYRAHVYADLLTKYKLDIFAKPIANILKKLPASDKKTTIVFKLLRFLPYISERISARHFLWKVIFSEEGKRILYTDSWNKSNKNLTPTVNLWDSCFEEFKNHDSVSSAALADMSIYLPYDILTKVDISSMAHSLEVRVPLLDRRIIEFVSSLRDIHKIDLKKKKKPLRAAFEKGEFARVFNRPKQGFSIPASKWLKGPLKSLFMDAVDSAAFRNFGALNPEEVKKVFLRHENKEEDLGRPLWGLLMLALWADSMKR